MGSKHVLITNLVLYGEAMTSLGLGEIGEKGGKSGGGDWVKSIF